jgi:hypothetical protein
VSPSASKRGGYGRCSAQLVVGCCICFGTAPPGCFLELCARGARWGWVMQLRRPAPGEGLGLGGAFTAGQAAQRAPQKTTGLPLARRPRPSAESAPLSQPLYCLSTRPTSPPYPAPQLLSPPSPAPPSPDPLACDLQLASVAVSAARRDSASSHHPGRAYFSLPRRTCVCARQTAAPRPALPHVEHLHPDCRLAVYDEMSIRHLIRPSFRPASKERFEVRSRRCHGP